MKLSVQLFTCTAILGTAALLSAQPPQPTQPPQTTTQPPAQTATAPQTQTSPDSITVTGCLRSASSGSDMTGTTGTTGTAGATATGTTGAAADQSQQKFVLMDATRGKGDPANATTAEPDVKSSSAEKNTYRLIANPTALAPHVGKKLELTGTLEESTASQDAGSGAFAGRPMLRVTSGKIVGNSCDQQ